MKHHSTSNCETRHPSRQELSLERIVSTDSEHRCHKLIGDLLGLSLSPETSHGAFEIACSLNSSNPVVSISQIK